MKHSLEVAMPLSLQASRLNGIGGSDAPIIMGLTNWKSPLQLWAERVGITDEFIEPHHQDWLDLGTFVEPFIKKLYERTTVFKIDTSIRFFRAPKDSLGAGFAQCNVDGMLRDNALFPRGVWEAKFINPFHLKQWSGPDPPAKYYCQCQHNISVTNSDFADLTALIFGQKLKIFRIFRDEQYIKKLMEKERIFWDCVQTKTIPKASAADNNYLNQEIIYPNNTQKSSIVELGSDIQDYDDQIVKLNTEIDDLIEKKNEAMAAIKQAVGTHKGGVLPNGVVYKWSYRRGNEKTHRVFMRKTPSVKDADLG